MQMVHNNQSGSPNGQNPDEIFLFGVEFPSNSVNSVEQNGIGKGNGESLEEDGEVGFVVEAVSEVDNCGV